MHKRAADSLLILHLPALQGCLQSLKSSLKFTRAHPCVGLGAGHQGADVSQGLAPAPVVALVAPAMALLVTVGLRQEGVLVGCSCLLGKRLLARSRLAVHALEGRRSPAV